VALANSTKHTQKKPGLRERTDSARFSHLLWHLTRKWIGSILSTRSPQGARVLKPTWGTLLNEQQHRVQYSCPFTWVSYQTSCAHADAMCPRPARCTHAAARRQSIAYTPYAFGAQCALRMNIHDRQAAARSGRWRRDWSQRYTLCSDLNSQPKRPGDLDLWTLKVVSESCVTWATSVPILVFLGLSVLDLGLMYLIDRQTDVRQKRRLMPPP